MADPAAPAADDAPEVDVRLPGLLARFAEGRQTVTVRADSVAGALDRLLARHPALEPHLLDGRGQLRPHLTLLLDGSTVARGAAGDVALEAGAEVVVLQAVSGG